MDVLQQVDWNQMLTAFEETMFMSIVSLIAAVVIGLLFGVILYVTQDKGLYENKIVHKLLSFTINTLRAIPFIILLFLISPFTKIMVGSILGAKAALPALILSSAPYYARMCMIALNEVDKGVIEACLAMGAKPSQIITKVLLPESKPALISSATLMSISLVAYTAMAGAIGAGGLGNLAYLYGFARNNTVVMYTATLLVMAIVFAMQGVGDYIVKKIDKR